jgi:hypothetical protein
MPNDPSAVLELVHRNLSVGDPKNYRVYYDTEVKDAGQSVRVGLRDVPMPFRGFRVFLDLVPNANWGHQVAYLLASEDLTKCIRYNDQFPPFGGDAPANWRPLTPES